MYNSKENQSKTMTQGLTFSQLTRQVCLVLALYYATELASCVHFLQTRLQHVLMSAYTDRSGLLLKQRWFTLRSLDKPAGHRDLSRLTAELQNWK